MTAWGIWPSSFPLSRTLTGVEGGRGTLICCKVQLIGAREQGTHTHRLSLVLDCCKHSVTNGAGISHALWRLIFKLVLEEHSSLNIHVKYPGAHLAVLTPIHPNRQGLQIIAQPILISTQTQFHLLVFSFFLKPFTPLDTTNGGGSE